ncbi:hypothetical protein C8J57DRAFT_1495468 [Mycena rebaudengoi]|nr:hypothetical protein C8J57DRAFT_1495468 [Mycena rebaudengoi]
MPSLLEPYTTTYPSASSLSDEVWNALKSNPQNSNVILPIALKSLAREKNQETAWHDQYWIAGAYPIFIFTTHPIHHLTPDFLLPRLIRLAEALHAAVPIERVYSVFAPDAVTTMFVEIWSSLTGVGAYEGRSLLPRKTFMTVFPGLVYELRPAVDSDLEGASIKEAAILIRNQQIWVHGVRRAGDDHEEIASIAAFTRNSDTVATISKVFTNPAWRRKGCAERLVRRVCKHLLLTKESVALFVAHDNPAATNVYHRVGFLGLQGGAPVNGVDSWLEIGLDRTKIELGHCVTSPDLPIQALKLKTKAMSSKVLDALHTATVYSLVALSGYSIFVGVYGHRARMAAMTAKAKVVHLVRAAVEEQRQQEETTLALAAQAILQSKRPL